MKESDPMTNESENGICSFSSSYLTMFSTQLQASCHSAQTQMFVAALLHL
jgi:hypothetical protein